ncbi:hypothetical protein PSENEW3_00004831 [Picochlorum sp. SENEW3]|nr:hypothetical protein PSENEW3_00004831 [Picochlorum sp. SENEW3]
MTSDTDTMHDMDTSNRNVAHIVGRVLFCSVFLGAALNKIAHYDVATGGKRLVWEGTEMGSRMDAFLLHMNAMGLPIPLEKAWYPALMVVAILLELVGSILLIMNRALGARMLLVFVAAVTLIMHPAHEDDHEGMVHFYKNVSLAGGLIMYLAAAP